MGSKVRKHFINKNIRNIYEVKVDEDLRGDADDKPNIRGDI